MCECIACQSLVLSHQLYIQGAGQESALAEGLSDTVNIPSPAASLPQRHHAQLYTAVLQVQTTADSAVAPQPVDLVGVTPSTGPSTAPHGDGNPTEASHIQAAALQTEPGPSRPTAGTASAATIDSWKQCCFLSRLRDISQHDFYCILKICR